MIDRRSRKHEVSACLFLGVENWQLRLELRLRILHADDLMSPISFRRVP